MPSDRKCVWQHRQGRTLRFSLASASVFRTSRRVTASSRLRENGGSSLRNRRRARDVRRPIQIAGPVAGKPLKNAAGGRQRAGPPFAKAVEELPVAARQKGDAPVTDVLMRRKGITKTEKGGVKIGAHGTK